MRTARVAAPQRAGETVRILVAEDDAALAEALKDGLAQAGYAVDCLAHGPAVLEALKDDGFGLLILDLGLPRLDGFEVLRRLRQRNRMLPVLILSGREKAHEKVLGLDLGADDYLVKPFHMNELQARVRALLRRNQERSAQPLISYGKLTFDTATRTPSIGGRVLPLSPHEIGVLEVLLHRFDRVVSKDQIMERLYSYDRDAGYNAIEVYVHRLRRKLEGSGLAVRTHYGRGYALGYAALAGEEGGKPG